MTCDVLGLGRRVVKRGGRGLLLFRFEKGWSSSQSDLRLWGGGEFPGVNSLPLDNPILW